MDRPSLVFDAVVVGRAWPIALTCWVLSDLAVSVMIGNGSWMCVSRQCMIAASRPSGGRAVRTQPTRSHTSAVLTDAAAVTRAAHWHIQ